VILIFGGAGVVFRAFWTVCVLIFQKLVIIVELVHFIVLARAAQLVNRFRYRLRFLPCLAVFGTSLDDPLLAIDNLVRAALGLIPADEIVIRERPGLGIIVTFSVRRRAPYIIDRFPKIFGVVQMQLLAFTVTIMLLFDDSLIRILQRSLVAQNTPRVILNNFKRIGFWLFCVFFLLVWLIRILIFLKNTSVMRRGIFWVSLFERLLQIVMNVCNNVWYDLDV
jgi:hypothetical protein